MARFFSIMLFAAFAFIACGAEEDAPQNEGAATTEKTTEEAAAEPVEETIEAPPEPTEETTSEPAESPPEATVSEPAEETVEETTEAPVANPELDAMRDGGFVIFVRHPETDASPTSADADGHLEDLGDCSLQRNLTDAGREDARNLGEDIERLDVPVGDVFASPYCRTSESAELVFGQAEIVPELATPRYLFEDGPEVDARIGYLREVFSTRPAEGTNMWVMTHELNLRLASGASVPEGGAVVFEPRGEDGFEVFATLPPEWWEEA